MIQLNPDCLIFQTAAGENIPCSAELVTIELIGEAASSLDPDVIENASAAVLHYFKKELGRTFVTVAEFAEALEKVLRGFGLSVKKFATSGAKQRKLPRVAEDDLRQIAAESGKGFELFFFSNLREHLHQKIASDSPEIVRFNGLRSCVKQLVGARRWSHRCQDLNDQIVDYLRICLSAEGKPSCALVVR
ncbi:MAG: hypothetical protein JWM68_2691 [Verrucomicrobiales bacterium]|nr:hypothetical protein [Verrucomicrobiales bacterium]